MQETITFVFDIKVDYSGQLFVPNSQSANIHVILNQWWLVLHV